MTVGDLLPFVYALSIGLLIGFERERSHPPEITKIGGSRTFALVAICGALAARLDVLVLVAGLLSVAAFLVLGYRRTSLIDPGTTTEIALFATYLLGALTQQDPVVAVSLGILVTVLLASKARIHGLARSVVSDIEFEDALKFAVIAFVIFPLLPDRSIGPYDAINPHEIWLLVVAFTGISWVGYIAVRILGPRRGVLVTGLAGGFVSASATTAAMGRRAQLGDVDEAVAGALLASVATFVQLEAIMVVASPEIALRLWPACLVGAGVLIGFALLDRRRHRGGGENLNSNETPTLDFVRNGAAEGRSESRDDFNNSRARPFALRSALVLATVLTCALLVGQWAATAFGSSGVFVSAGAAGLADAHAGALASAELFRAGAVGLATSLVAVAVAVSTNTITKVVLGFSTGGRAFGIRLVSGIVPAVAAFVATVGATVVLVGR
ncbi:MAG: DUF4010 domain-containing protein [Actinobacteria bacterium]|uniref:Unannotated protein n=1 Tax=freshwater metagenome TaxID=449393 RepID=A0A6J6HNB6_9ZZZZ|nr:DUF4010 domain-containing protein [Actinomycetota bacterium]MSZ93661.1 DUF4010 domain-containing protein [Actinomycetota bacterium]